MATELVLLGTAGAPMPVAGRGGISSAVVVDGRVFMVDCGRGSPSAFVSAGLDFTRLEAVFLTHMHVDHLGDRLDLELSELVQDSVQRLPVATADGDRRTLTSKRKRGGTPYAAAATGHHDHFSVHVDIISEVRLARPCR